MESLGPSCVILILPCWPPVNLHHQKFGMGINKLLLRREEMLPSEAICERHFGSTRREVTYIRVQAGFQEDASITLTAFSAHPKK